MNRSITITIIIAVLGAVPGFYLKRRLDATRVETQALFEEADRRGLSTGTRSTKRTREDMERQSAASAGELIALARELEFAENSGDDSDADLEKRSLEMMRSLAALDPSHVRNVISSIRDSDEISDEMRGDIIGFSVITLSQSDPGEAIRLFMEWPDLLDEGSLSEQALDRAMTRWGELNPGAGLAWIQENAGKYPKIVTEESKYGFIAGVARNDPGFAFRLLDAIEFDDQENALHQILDSGDKDPGQRDLVLGALRGYLDGIADEEAREEMGAKALEIYARSVEGENMESLTGWMEDSKFTTLEKEQFAGGLTYFATKEDTGRWIEWLGRQDIKEGALAGTVRDLVSEWTQQDYLAAGNWLSGFPDGPAKSAAVEAYAEAVAEYEPHVAGQWAMTLPPGRARDTALNRVYQNWPESDREGAAAFAREHGLD